MIADTISIESEDRGFELHISSDEGDFVFNIQALADAFYDVVVQQIGPWRSEMLAAKREYDTGIADDPAMQPLLDQIKRKPVTEPCWCWNDPELAPRGLYCPDCQDVIDDSLRVDHAETFDNVYKMMKENPR